MSGPITTETGGSVEHIVTPVGAFGWIVAEDALDRYLVKWAEGSIKHRVMRAVIRSVANPGRALSSSASGRAPWHRDGRPVGWR